MDRWKVEMGRVTEERRSEKRKSQKYEDADARKGRKVAKHCVFPKICGSGGSKSRLAKAAGAEPAGQMRDEKLHTVVARSTFRSQNVQNTTAPDHFWQLRCRKSARRCGAKHISKSKCTKHTRSGPLLAVEMSKKCTPLRREAHFEVKMYKTPPHVRTTFGSWDVEKVHAVVARSTFRSQNVQNTTCSDHFWKLRCRKSAHRCGAKHISKSKCENTRGSDHFWRFRCRFASLHYTTLHYTKLHYTTLHYTTLHSTTLQLQLHNYTTLYYTPLHSTTTLHSTTLQIQLQLHNYSPLHSTTLHYTPLHYITLHYTTFRYTSLHYSTLHSTSLQLQLQLHSTTLHYTPLHSTTLHYTTLHYTTLHSTTLHYTTVHYLPLHSTTLNCTTLHYTTLQYIPLHSTTLHYTTLHYTEWHCTTDRQVEGKTDR